MRDYFFAGVLSWDFVQPLQYTDSSFLGPSVSIVMLSPYKIILYFTLGIEHGRGTTYKSRLQAVQKLLQSISQMRDPSTIQQSRSKPAV